MSVGGVSVGVCVSCVTVKFKCDGGQRCVGVHVDMCVWGRGVRGGGMQECIVHVASLYSQHPHPPPPSPPHTHTHAVEARL